MKNKKKHKEFILFKTKTGLPHGQEIRKRREKLNGKSQAKMGVFEKRQEKFIKKHQILSFQIYHIHYI